MPKRKRSYLLRQEYRCREVDMASSAYRIHIQASGLCQRCDIRRQVCLSGLRRLRSRGSRQEQDGGWQTSSLRQDPSYWYYQRTGKNSLELCQLRNTL